MISPKSCEIEDNKENKRRFYKNSKKEGIFKF